MERWQRRDLSAKRYVYFWVDGIYFGARLEEEKQCILVIIGATDHGTKELIAITDGYRESEQSWREVLLDLKRRGLGIGPELVTGDGALGFWKALRQVYGAAREQRCWVHKTGNILNKLPKGLQNKAKGHLQDIWMAETRKDAETALLRLPRRALEACADDEPHREHLRHGSPSHLSDQGLPVTQDGDGHGLQALPGGQQEMAEAQWIRSVRRDHSRRQIREWRTPGSRRRMTNPYTTFDNSSARFGRINDPKRCWSPKRTRPTVGKQIIRGEYTYAYGAVSPRDGAADFLILPVMTAVAMKVFLDELARRHDGQYILMIYDGAPCHSPGALNIPDTMTVRTLPPYSPQLNPVENIWDGSSPTSSSNPWMPSKTKSPKPASTTRKTRKLSDPSPLSHGLMIIYRWRIGMT